MSGEGKLYRVKEEALEQGTAFAKGNRAAVATHGHLWVCEGAPVYRSITTGVQKGWLASELEELE